MDEENKNYEILVENDKAYMKIWFSIDYYKKLLEFQKKHNVKNIAYILDIAVTQLLEQEANPDVEILCLENGTVQIKQKVKLL